MPRIGRDVEEGIRVRVVRVRVVEEEELEVVVELSLEAAQRIAGGGGGIGFEEERHLAVAGLEAVAPRLLLGTRRLGTGTARQQLQLPVLLHVNVGARIITR